LEHEFDHAVNHWKEPSTHRARKGKVIADYDTEEERRVINGSEVKTARLNKESVRYSHYGKTYDTTDPTSTKKLIK